ncbi:MAG: ABC transporter permease, partial [Rubripirellula sp.]
MLPRLIWKDATTVKPLMWAALIAVVVLNLLLFLLWQGRDINDRGMIEFSIALWILIPQLVAFGVPAMLIGTEEEQGTLNWMRTLPVSWRTIATAKLLVGVGATALIWALSSSVIFLMSYGWSDSPYVTDFTLVSPAGVVMVLMNSAMLMMLGFLLAYMIRSPLIALVVLVLVYAFVSILFLNFAHWMRWESSFFGLASVTAIGVGILLTSWGLQWLFARQRLLLPQETSGPSYHGATPVYAYRPPIVSVPGRPSELASLLWQQIRQTGPMCIIMLGMANILVLIFCVTQRQTPFEGPMR